jgi:hypothetical protein
VPFFGCPAALMAAQGAREGWALTDRPESHRTKNG